jgi:hypothetical protein
MQCRVGICSDEAWGSSSSGPSFLTLPTFLSTGHTRSTSSGAGLSSAPTSPSVSPSHIGQSAGSMMTGIRGWIVESWRLASVVMVENVCKVSPSGAIHASHIPPKTTGSPSRRPTANGAFPSGVVPPLVIRSRGH